MLFPYSVKIYMFHCLHLELVIAISGIFIKHGMPLGMEENIIGVRVFKCCQVNSVFLTVGSPGSSSV